MKRKRGRRRRCNLVLIGILLIFLGFLIIAFDSCLSIWAMIAVVLCCVGTTICFFAGRC